MTKVAPRSLSAVLCLSILIPGAHSLRASIPGDPGFGLTSLTPAPAVNPPMDDSNSLRMPYVGDHQLRVITPTLLELTLITTTSPSNALPAQWAFADTAGNLLTLPALAQCVVTANNLPVPVTGLGFKRRVLYAPLRQWDLRVANYLYLQLATPIAAGAAVQVLNPDTTLWAANVLFTNAAAPLRYSPAIHVNQVGYIPNLPKKAMIGYYLGSLGELNTSLLLSFSLVDAHTGATVYSGSLAPNPDIGYSYTPTPYQQVLEADFSSFQTPGEYKLVVPNLGASFPFFIDPGIAGAFARTYELGIYGQRCGTNNVIPYSRFTHGACHTNPASVPLSGPSLTFVNQVLNNESAAGTNNALETAPRMTNIWASLYPYVNTNALDTRGGHHDAGDYSKYTTSIANFVHCLTFAVDAFPGVKNLDNLGIPESGDGISDIIQEAKWEADYLAKLQDADGGFYFIVYPATRQYEGDVLPDHGDPQIVLPKNTACTAAAVAALAEIGSSPTFKAAYPTVASNYLVKAVAGWGFLTNAIAKYGRNGSYQTITFSGDWMMHNDELAWAAAALFAATGDPQYDNDLRANTPNPNDPALRRWNWLSMYGCYGNAFRTYAFAARSGRLQTNQLNAAYLKACETEIKTAGTNAVVWSGEMAYGSSFSIENKGLRVAGWYFSGEQTFDPAVAYLIDPQPAYLDVIVKNFNYELGCNPVNVSFLTGTGWKRQREIVHQYAQNDYRVLPPSGIPLGNITANFYWTGTYQTELDALCFPSDEAFTAPYPMYDRWADAYNVSTEFVVSQETARSLVGALSLMAMSSVTNQPWNSAIATITGLPAQASATAAVTASLNVPGIDMSKARVVWEARDQDPYIGANFTFTPVNAGPQWVEVEAMLPDGRRVVALTNYTAIQTVTNTISLYQTIPLAGNTNVVAWYTFDSTFADAKGREGSALPEGNAVIDTNSFYWPGNPLGGALRVYNLGDEITASLANADLFQSGLTTNLSIEAMFYVNAWKGYSIGNGTILALTKSWNSELALRQNIWKQNPAFSGAGNIILDDATFSGLFKVGRWQHLKIALDNNGYSVYINGSLALQTNSGALTNWGGTGTVLLEAGNFDGWIDEIVVKSYGTGTNTSIVLGGGGGTGGGSGGGTSTNLPPPNTTSTTTVLAQGTTYVTGPVTTNNGIVALYHLDGSLADGVGKNSSLTLAGNAAFDSSNLSWMSNPSGSALRVLDIGDQATVTLSSAQYYVPGQTQVIAVEAMIYANAYTAYSRQGAPILVLSKSWNSQLVFKQDLWGYSPELIGGNQIALPASALTPYLATNCWQKIGVLLDVNGYSLRVNDTEVARFPSGDITNWSNPSTASLQFGNFNGWIDEVVVRSSTTTNIGAPSQPGPPAAPSISVASLGSAYEAGPINSGFAITRSGTNLSQPLTVNFSVSGSAVSGVNYAPIGSSVVIPAGAASVNAVVTPIHDGVFTGPLTLNLALGSSANYQLGSAATASLTIMDADQPVLNVVSSTGAGATGGHSSPPPPTQVQLSATGAPGISYLLEYSTNLTSWSYLFTNTPGASLSFVDTIATNLPCRYYRTLYVPGSLSASNVAFAAANAFYSADAVGYVNLTVAPGTTIIANPFNIASNTISALFPNVPDRSQVFDYVPGVGYAYASGYAANRGGWLGANPTLSPGQGASFQNYSGTNAVLTLVGTIPQGTLTTALPGGFSLVSPMTPVATALGTLPGASGDQFYRWVNGAWVIYNYGSAGWNATNYPALNPGEAFFLFKTAPATWTVRYRASN